MFYDQLQLLQNNPEVESLHLHLYLLNSSSLPRIITDTFHAVSGAIKELHLEKGAYHAEDFLPLLRCFPHLEQLYMSDVYFLHKTYPSENSSVTISPHGTGHTTMLESIFVTGIFDDNKCAILKLIFWDYHAVNT